MWIVCITSVRHVLTVNGYGGRQTKENEKSWCFKGWETLVILDGDVRMNKNDLRKINNADNILILPGNKSPERLLASYLYNLSDVDPLWSKIADGYTKQFCFREYSMEQINAGGELGRQNAKKWFNSQLEYWGRNGCKVLNPFLSSISEEAQEFRTNFDNMIKQYIHD